MLIAATYPPPPQAIPTLQIIRPAPDSVVQSPVDLAVDFLVADPGAFSTAFAGATGFCIRFACEQEAQTESCFDGLALSGGIHLHLPFGHCTALAVFRHQATIVSISDSTDFVVAPFSAIFASFRPSISASLFASYEGRRRIVLAHMFGLAQTAGGFGSHEFTFLAADRLAEGYMGAAVAKYERPALSQGAWARVTNTCANVHPFKPCNKCARTSDSRLCMPHTRSRFVAALLCRVLPFYTDSC